MIDMRLTYNCDRNLGRIRKDEGHLVELAAAAPGLGKGHPVGFLWSEVRLSSLSWVIDGNFHTIRRHCIQTLLDLILSSIFFWRNTYLSPNPWAMITVAVCFVSAGTMYGPRVILKVNIWYEI